MIHDWHRVGLTQGHACRRELGRVGSVGLMDGRPWELGELGDPLADEVTVEILIHADRETCVRPG